MLLMLFLKEIQKALSKWRYLSHRQEFPLRFTLVKYGGKEQRFICEQKLLSKEI